MAGIAVCLDHQLCRLNIRAIDRLTQLNVKLLLAGSLFFQITVNDRVCIELINKHQNIVRIVFEFLHGCHRRLLAIGRWLLNGFEQRERGRHHKEDQEKKSDIHHGSHVQLQSFAVFPRAQLHLSVPLIRFVRLLFPTQDRIFLSGLRSSLHWDLTRHILAL